MSPIVSGSPGILRCGVIDSTNSEAERQLAAGRRTPFVVIARSQTQGRGRFSRAWASPDAGNLYLSAAFRPGVEAARMQNFTLWMGVNVCDAIAGFTGLPPRIKWPNDLLLDGRKFGGMLTEARMDSDRIRDLIFGLGVNVNSRMGDLPPELAPAATTLAAAAGRPFDQEALAAAIIGRILSAYDALIGGRHQEPFGALWARYDLLNGREVTLTQGDETRSGVVCGISPDGALRVRHAGGAVAEYRAGDVTLRPKMEAR